MKQLIKFLIGFFSTKPKHTFVFYCRSLESNIEVYSYEPDYTKALRNILDDFKKFGQSNDFILLDI